MMTIRLAISALVTVGLAGASFAAQAKTSKQVTHHVASPHVVRHHVGRSHVVPRSYVAPAQFNPSTSGISAPRSGTYGASGNSVGTVTAPSVGSYNWPSVGVTNSVPTWSNTNPPARR
jgi:hypothetical protein